MLLEPNKQNRKTPAMLILVLNILVRIIVIPTLPSMINALAYPLKVVSVIILILSVIVVHARVRLQDAMFVTAEVDSTTNNESGTSSRAVCDVAAVLYE